MSTTNWQRAWEPAPPDPGIKPNGIRARALRAVLVRGPRAETLAATQRSWDYCESCRANDAQGQPPRLRHLQRKLLAASLRGAWHQQCRGTDRRAAGRRAMRRRGSRRLERAIRDLINRDGGHCSVCRDPFAHGADLAYGSTQERAIAVVGECCDQEADPHGRGRESTSSRPTHCRANWDGARPAASSSIGNDIYSPLRLLTANPGVQGLPARALLSRRRAPATHWRKPGRNERTVLGAASTTASACSGTARRCAASSPPSRSTGSSSTSTCGTSCSRARKSWPACEACCCRRA